MRLQGFAKGLTPANDRTGVRRLPVATEAKSGARVSVRTVLVVLTLGAAGLAEIYAPEHMRPTYLIGTVVGRISEATLDRAANKQAEIDRETKAFELYYNAQLESIKAHNDLVREQTRAQCDAMVRTDNSIIAATNLAGMCRMTASFFGASDIAQGCGSAETDLRRQIADHMKSCMSSGLALLRSAPLDAMGNPLPTPQAYGAHLAAGGEKIAFPHPTFAAE